MISAHLMGGLGNFMFQIAASHDLAVKNKDECIIFDKPLITVHGKLETYKNNIFHKIKFINKSHKNVYEDMNCNYKPIVYQKDLIIRGYFQSEKYFDRKTILDLYKMDDESFIFIKNNIKELFEEECVSIHVRRGDYVHKQERHPVQSMDFYNNAISHFNKNYKFLVLSDDINWCKQNFKNNNIKFIENLPDYIDLNIMRLCKHNIISNSTFSWWGAWLNENQDKKIISPKNWFGPKKNNCNTKDLIPDVWIQI